MSPVKMFGINAKREDLRQPQCTFGGIESSVIPLYHLVPVMNFSETNWCQVNFLCVPDARNQQPQIMSPNKVRNGHGAPSHCVC